MYDVNIYTNCIDTQRDGFDNVTSLTNIGRMIEYFFNKFAVITFYYDKKSYTLNVMFKFLTTEIFIPGTQSYLLSHVQQKYIEVCLD